MTVIKRIWLPALVVFAIAIGMVAVSNLRSVFGSDGAIVTPIDADTAENFNPKVVKYEIFGTGSYATINSWLRATVPPSPAASPSTTRSKTKGRPTV
ncbi:MAG: rane protein [Mycobacterium sp.]|nr:rane protein [Mycobacterium sp.]